MFGIGIGELLLILALALALVGPADLPKVARWLARALRAIRRTVKDFTASLNIEEDINEVKEAGKTLHETMHEINPMAELTDELEQVKRETREGIQNMTKDIGITNLEANHEVRNN